MNTPNVYQGRVLTRTPDNSAPGPVRFVILEAAGIGDATTALIQSLSQGEELIVVEKLSGMSIL